MDVREKLVELLNQIIDGGFKWSSHLYESGEQLNTDEIATQLIAHGVTVQERAQRKCIKQQNGYHLYAKCECGLEINADIFYWNFFKKCPNCGAKMEEHNG